MKQQILDELNVKDLFMDEMHNIVKLDGKGYEIAGSEQKMDKKTGSAVFGAGVYLVAIPTDITPELAAEGLAREIVHRLQNMRRSSEFDIADHIITYYDGDDYVKQVMQDWTDYIKQETLSRELVEGVPEEDAFTESYTLSGYEMRLGVKRAD